LNARKNTCLGEEGDAAGIKAQVPLLADLETGKKVKKHSTSTFF
jgi:hypothetical protein